MNQTLKKELLAQLQHLRTETKEISRLYVANLQHDIVQLIEFLNEKPVTKTRSARTVDPIFLQLKEKLDGLNVKPEKGRRKDLRRIEDAVRSMRKIALSDKKAE
jgi:hypothetical protein